MTTEIVTTAIRNQRCTHFEPVDGSDSDCASPDGVKKLTITALPSRCPGTFVACEGCSARQAFAMAVDLKGAARDPITLPPNFGDRIR